MKKLFTSLCATLLISSTLLTPVGKISNASSSARNIAASTYGFYLAIEGQ